MNNPLWVIFRDWIIQLGYFHREYSWYTYLIIVILLFILHFKLVNTFKNIPIFKLAFIIGIICFFSYPLLSHDLFSYIFDAKIFTVYGRNPYLTMPVDIQGDDWLRFMHWTHRRYPYGPVFLVLSFIPSYLSFGKFLLNFLFFKAFFIAFYFVGVYFMNRINKKYAVIFATHPLVIIEGLVNVHNDLVAVSLAIMGTFYLLNKKRAQSIVFFILSAAIKYTTLPLLVLQKNPKSILTIGALIMQTAMILFLALYQEVQPWYFLTYFIFLPFYPRIIGYLNITLFGLLMGYYPYIYEGQWTVEREAFKHTILFFFIALNIAYILYKEHKIIKSFLLKNSK